jgi:hypothetical protein
LNTTIKKLASGDPLDALLAAVLADVLGRVADAVDVAICRLASRALLAVSYLCPRVRLCATLPPTAPAAGAMAGLVPPRSARPLRTLPLFSDLTVEIEMSSLENQQMNITSQKFSNGYEVLVWANV